MNLEALATELTNDPLARGYATMTPVQAAASLMTANRNVRRLVPTWQIKKAVIEMGQWGLIVIASQSSSTAATKALAISVLAYVDDPSGKIEAVDMDLASTQGMMTGLVGAGLLSQQQANELSALASKTISRAEELGLGLVEEKHIRDARSLI